jgi:ribonuclease D
LKAKKHTIELYRGDLPEGLDFGTSIAVDTETLGLNPARDRLCLLQLTSGDNICHLVQFTGTSYDAPNLKSVLDDERITKIFHYARFDLAVIERYLGVACTPVYCTKIASKLARTYTDRHGLRDLCRELLGVDMDKNQQSSDWGAENLTAAQKKYAAADVVYLHALRKKLDHMLAREARTGLADACFQFLPTRARLDDRGWSDLDVFSH